MSKGRLEAFSDGVIAILITLMVFNIKPPDTADLDALKSVAPALLTYLLSFIYLGIYWNNHHHMLHITKAITGRVLWANLHLLFWLALIPFTTAWMSGTNFASVPTAAYGAVLFTSAFAWIVLQTSLVADKRNKELANALGRDLKGKFSIIGYLVAIAIAIKSPAIAITIYALLASIWLVPDRRFE